MSVPYDRPPGLYIISDADHFTTCCRPTRAELAKEIARLSLRTPLLIHHWIDVQNNPATLVEIFGHCQ